LPGTVLREQPGLDAAGPVSAGGEAGIFVSGYFRTERPRQKGIKLLGMDRIVKWYPTVAEALDVASAM
jgi:hypothetical protein